MNKSYFFLIGILLINLASATITIFPNPSDITQKVNTEGTFQITLTNNYDFEIMDFQFGDLSSRGFTFPDITIPKNSSKVIDFTVLPTTSAHENIQVPVSFKYKVSLPGTTQTHYINITDLGFIPNHLDIRQDDTVIWTNIDTISHTVTSALFDQTLLPNQTFSFIFTQLGTVSYNDLNLFFGGTINVLSKTSVEKAHNPNYDINWAVNFNAILNPTNLTITNSKETYEIEYTESDVGMLTIKNDGTETAELISITSTSDWVSFNKNNIDIEPGKEGYVEYTIVPIVFNTSDTDKNYEITLTIKASNSQAYPKKINVYVPFAEIKFDESDPEYLLKLIENFCQRNPNNVFCNPPDSTNESVIYKDFEIPINLSAKEFHELLRREQTDSDALQRTINILTQLADKYGTSFPQIINQLNQSLQIAEKSEKRSRRTNNATWIIFFFILIIGLIGATIKILL